MKTTTKVVVIDGVEVEVEVYPPSRRKASSSVQRPRYQRNSKGAKWMAGENGQFVEKE